VACGAALAPSWLGPYLEDATPIDVAGKMADVLGGFQPPKGY
jgi:hypothetical protein